MGLRPTMGLIRVRQVTPHGRLDGTIRRLQNALRAPTPCRGATASPSTLVRPMCARSIRLRRGGRLQQDAWLVMLVRREAIESAAFLNERYSCTPTNPTLPADQGRAVGHTSLVIDGDHSPRAQRRATPSIVSLEASSRALYVRRPFPPVHHRRYFGALQLGAPLRSVYGGSGEHGRLLRRPTVGRAMLGRVPAPFGPPNRYSVRIAGPEQRHAGRHELPTPNLTT
jgi:hypothetical protein